LNVAGNMWYKNLNINKAICEEQISVNFNKTSCLNKGRVWVRNAELVIFRNAPFWRMITRYGSLLLLHAKQDYSKTNMVRQGHCRS